MAFRIAAIRQPFGSRLERSLVNRSPMAFGSRASRASRPKVDMRRQQARRFKGMASSARSAFAIAAVGFSGTGRCLGDGQQLLYLRPSRSRFNGDVVLRQGRRTLQARLVLL